MQTGTGSGSTGVTTTAVSATTDLVVAAGSVTAGQLVSMNLNKIVAGLPRLEFETGTAAYPSAHHIENTTHFVVAFRDEGPFCFLFRLFVNEY